MWDITRECEVHDGNARPMHVKSVYFGGQWWVSGIWCQFLNVDMFQLGNQVPSILNSKRHLGCYAKVLGIVS